MKNNSASGKKRMNNEDVRKPVVISVLSGKGGVGKSTVSYHLARTLSQEHKVLLADCDLLFGDLHVIANVMPRCTVDRFIMHGDSLKKPSVINENLDLLASPSTSGRELTIEFENILTGLNDFPEKCSAYDYLIIDTPSGVIDVIMAVAGISDIRLVCLMPELTAISDGYGLIKYMKTLGAKGPIYILPSRCHSHSEAGYIHGKFADVCKRFLKLRPDCLGYIYENQYLKAGLTPGSGRVDATSEAPILKDFLSLADAIRSINNTAKTNIFNRLRSVNAKRSEADTRG